MVKITTKGCWLGICRPNTRLLRKRCGHLPGITLSEIQIADTGSQSRVSDFVRATERSFLVSITLVLDEVSKPFTPSQHPGSTPTAERLDLQDPAFHRGQTPAHLSTGLRPRTLTLQLASVYSLRRQTTLQGMRSQRCSRVAGA